MNDERMQDKKTKEQEEHEQSVTKQSVTNPFPRPHSAGLHPVLAFKDFLQSLDKPTNPSERNTRDPNDPSTPRDVSNSGHSLTIKQDILRMANFLFGNMLDSALSTLDSYIITEIQSVQSKRRIFVLANPHHGRPNSPEPNIYFCILPQTSLPPKEGTKQRIHPAKCTLECTDNILVEGQFLFCSCRSYFERTKSQLGSEGSPQTSLGTQRHTLCKHLLALVLRPFLLDSCHKIEVVTEEQFGQELLNRLLCEKG